MMRISATCDWSILVASLSRRGIGAMRLGHPRHVDGLRVVRDHPLHELDVGHGIDGAGGDDDVVHARMLCQRTTRSNGHQRQGAECEGEGWAKESGHSVAGWCSIPVSGKVSAPSRGVSLIGGVRGRDLTSTSATRSGPRNETPSGSPDGPPQPAHRSSPPAFASRCTRSFGLPWRSVAPHGITFRGCGRLPNGWCLRKIARRVMSLAESITGST